MKLPKRSYVLTVCHNLGIPDMWIEDAVQDVLLACWRDDNDFVHRRAIDAARKYGPKSKSNGKYMRLVCVGYTCLYEGKNGDKYEDEQPGMPNYNPYPLCDKIMDFRAAWAKLYPTHQKVLIERIQRDDWPNAHQVRVSQARKVLKKHINARAILAATGGKTE